MNYKNNVERSPFFALFLVAFVVYMIVCFKVNFEQKDIQVSMQNDKNVSDVTNNSDDTDISEQKDQKDDKNNEEIVEGENNYYYNKLNAESRKLYKESLKFICDGKIKYKLQIDDKFSNKNFENAIDALTKDHPELFWINGGWENSYNETECNITLKTHEFVKYTMNFDNKSKEINNVVNKVIEEANQYNSDSERIKCVHDYIVNNTSYAFDDLEKMYSNYHDASCEYIYTAYGCLVNKKAVCAGYAKAFQLILSRMGYMCTYVTGQGNGENHAWNLIVLDNTDYYVDVTWDDPYYIENGKKVEGKTPQYKYFMISKDEMSRDHTFDELKY